MLKKRRKRRHPEQDLQRAVIAFLDLALPKRDSFWFAVPNGAVLVSPREGAKLKWLGGKPGVPDIMILYRGLAFGLELKTGPNKLSDAQIRVHQEMVKAGCYVAVCYSVDEVKDALIGWNVPLHVTGGSILRLPMRDAAI